MSKGGGRETTGVTAFGEKPPDLASGARDPKLVHTVPESAGVEAEDLGGPTWACNEPVGLFQDATDVIALHGVQPRQRLARGPPGDCGCRVVLRVSAIGAFLA